MEVVDSWDMDLPDKYTNWVDTCNPMPINVVSIYMNIGHGFMWDLIHDFINFIFFIFFGNKILR
jgi:DUF2075 family protein